MPTEFTCEQGHAWLSTEATDESCPICGGAGWNKSFAQATRSFGSTEETIAPEELPPLVSQIRTLLSDSSAVSTGGALPDQIGDYEILGELGRGGMGVVYKARQTRLDRLVALKVVGAGSYVDERDILRFLQEAEAIARLQHPNIVQIYEIGDWNGRPYLVLEFVDGPSLMRLPHKPLAPDSAAKLLQTLSRAMEHAHRRGIVHRDLTPSNILLAIEGGRTKEEYDQQQAWLPRAVPKITDFGLAKRLDSDSSRTRDGTVMGTPSYMSPEQADGRILEAGPPADVYALGAVLYDLLTGRPPFLGDTARATLEQVINSEPVPPTRLQPRVPRDLETICLKCLDKQAAKRYQTAGELADDIERFLENRPILARRTGPIARLWKWTLRYPAAAALILFAIGSLFVALGASQWHNAVVRHERNLAEEDLRVSLDAVDKMLTEVGEEQLAYEPRMELKRRALLQKALVLYQQFLKQRSGDMRLRAEVAHGNRRVGDVERWLGNHAQAKIAYQDAIDLFAALRPEKEGLLVYGRWQAYCLNFLGESQRQLSQPQQAEKSYQAAIAIQQELAAAHPKSPDFQLELARTHYNLGILYRETNRASEAEKVLRYALARLEEIARMDNQRVDSRQELARVCTNLGPILRTTQRTREAIDVYSRAIGILTSLTSEHPTRADFQFELAVAHANRGNALRAEQRPAEAKADYEFARHTLAELVSDYPSVALFLQELSNSENSLAAVLFETDGPAAAESVWLSARDRLQKLADQSAALPVYRGDLGMTLGNLGWVSLRGGDAQQARGYLEDGIARLKEALEANPKQPDYLLSLRSQYRNLADASLRTNDHAAADRAATELTRVAGATPGDTFAAACFSIRCGAAAKDDPALAGTYFDQAAKRLQQLQADGFRDARLLQQAQQSLGDALEIDAAVHNLFQALLASAQ